MCAWKKMTTQELEVLNINELLPPELLLEVFQKLPPRVLLKALLVCRLWHSLALQAPQLWTWLHLTGLSKHSNLRFFSNFQSGRRSSLWLSPSSALQGFLCSTGFSIPTSAEKLILKQSQRLAWLEIYCHHQHFLD